MSKLLNWSNVPTEDLGGVSTELLDFITNESDERYLHELDSQFLTANLGEFDNIPNITIEDIENLNKLEKESIPSSTATQTRRHVNLFRDFLKSKNLCVEFETVPNEILCNYLRLFYAQLRTKEGSYYSPPSLICYRAAIHRHLTSCEVNRKINICCDEDFKRANAILAAMIGEYKKAGIKKTKPYGKISDSDMIKLNEYFKSHRSTPQEKQLIVAFNIMYYFCLRGRETLRSLKQNSIGFDIDDSGKEYAFIQTSMLSKNVKASLNAKDFEDIKGARMYPMNTNESGVCPLKILHEYLQLLPKETKENCLFPLPTKNGYSSIAVVGKNTLGNLMPKLSHTANLSQRYTNHCVRVTVINKLNDSGLSYEDIATVSGE